MSDNPPKQENLEKLSFKEKLLLAQQRVQQNSQIQNININKNIPSQQPAKPKTKENNEKAVPIIDNSSLKNENIKDEYTELSFKDKLRLAQDNSKTDSKAQLKNQEIMNDNNTNNKIISEIEHNKNNQDEGIPRRNKNELNKSENIKTDELSFKEKLQIAQTDTNHKEINNEQINIINTKMKSAENSIKTTKEQFKTMQNDDTKSINNNDSKNSETVNKDIHNEIKNETAELSFKEKLRLAREFSQTVPTNKINTIKNTNQSKNSTVINNPNKQLNENHKADFDENKEKPTQNISSTPNKLNDDKSTSSNFKEILKLAQKRALNTLQDTSQNNNDIINTKERERENKLHIEQKVVKQLVKNDRTNDKKDVLTNYEIYNKIKESNENADNELFNQLQRRKNISEKIHMIENEISKPFPSEDLCKREKILKNDDIDESSQSSSETEEEDSQSEEKSINETNIQNNVEKMKVGMGLFSKKLNRMIGMIMGVFQKEDPKIEQEIESLNQVDKEILQKIKIDFNNNEQVHEKIDEIRKNITESVTFIDKKNCIVIKNSLESFLNSIVFDTIVNGNFCQKNMILKVYKAKINSLKNEINRYVSIIDEIYKEKFEGIESDEEMKDEDEMKANSTLYVMSEKESFKEITIDIASESDLNRKIPQDF